MPVQPVMMNSLVLVAGVMAVRTMMVRSNRRMARRMPQPVMVPDPLAAMGDGMFRMLPAVVDMVPGAPSVMHMRSSAVVRRVRRIHREGRRLGRQGRKRRQGLAVRRGGQRLVGRSLRHRRLGGIGRGLLRSQPGRKRCRDRG